MPKNAIVKTKKGGGPSLLTKALQTLSLLSDETGVSAAKIHTEGHAQFNWQTEERATEKLLKALEVEGYVCRNDDEKTHLWLLARSAASLFKSAKTVDSIALELVGTFEKLMPPEAVTLLQEKIQIARETLRNRRHVDVTARWSDKIAVRPAGWSPLPPRTSPQILATVQDCLYRDKRLWFTYRKKPSAAVDKGRTVNPRGLLIKADVFMLLADQMPNDTSLKWFRVDRMVSACLVDAAVTDRNDFDFHRYVNEGNTEFGPDMERCNFKAWISDDLRDTVLEQPYTENQTITKSPDGHGWILEAELVVGWHARNFFVSRGESMRVLEPVKLADECRRRLEAALEKYV